MAYRYHPEIEGLKVNEDGSGVIYLGETLEVKKSNRAERTTDLQYINFRGNAYSIAKLVCECWNGMAENPRWCATRKVKSKGFHYTNLFFAPCGTNPERKNNARGTRSKIKKEDVPVIEKRLKKGETLKAIAKDYNTSDMSISRIRKNMNANE
ncbi:hypothetical protein QWY81_17715 [Polaribacter undariae]|uniref:Uncharacterized protein n=1 Tax=Polaribacter sejongensis TaxID=985043 RepID=A0AAJ1VII6_9FLAO|nr:hypothetical protein [Polaribacter undariae]MDN3621309.1 hypothetical protein [Polaribacter undariae]UWD31851.1 hypothetical protein NQP51_17180 [Polaribacter undariae]